MRDMTDYSGRYLLPGFEEYKVLYRRRKILEIVEAEKPTNILEIGCGYEPLFQYVKDVSFTVVEPADAFYERAAMLAQDEASDRVKCIHGFFEEKIDELTDDFDMIICSSLLHEVEYPDRLLQAIAKCADQHTIVHINVPNANSMHRLLGQAIGMLSDIHDKSEGNIAFQQNNVFDMESLEKIVINNGLNVLERGSFFVKPFSHAQMYEMMKQGILNDQVLDGLYQLGEVMPAFGSEIYVNCRLKDRS